MLSPLDLFGLSPRNLHLYRLKLLERFLAEWWLEFESKITTMSSVAKLTLFSFFGGGEELESDVIYWGSVLLGLFRRLFVGRH